MGEERSGQSRASQAIKRWMATTITSQTELARLVTEKLGRVTTTPVNQSTISSWVRGAYPPGGPAMVALFEITGTPLSDWLLPPDEGSSRDVTDASAAANDDADAVRRNGSEG